MFKVKATMVKFLGDPIKYPCHFQHKIGDEIIFDGERYTGRLCPDLWPLLVPKMNSLWEAGPRFTPSEYYLPLWYASLSIDDPTKKVSDGLGFANVLKTYDEPQYHISKLMPENAWKWPPYRERTIGRSLTVTCHDTRTLPFFVLEAFDLCDKGLSIPYFRREMAILNKVLARPGISPEKILGEFSRKEIEDIYPALSQQIIVPFIEELQVMNYLKIENGGVFVTKSGETKLNNFKSTLTEEERRAINI